MRALGKFCSFVTIAGCLASRIGQIGCAEASLHLFRLGAVAKNIKTTPAFIRSKDGFYSLAVREQGYGIPAWSLLVPLRVVASKPDVPPLT
jgi:hypothetical protein